jgi:ClpP class serine protease
MRFNSPLSAALAGQFLLEESAVPGFLMQVAQLLTSSTSAPAPAAGTPTPAACFAISADATSVQLRPYGSLDDVPAGSVAVTVVSGVMMPYDDYDYDAGYVPGTRTLAARIQQADAHPNIVAHVGLFATPGGSVMGLEHFADIIAGTEKPFVSFVEMMCSAGFWAGSGANQTVVARTGIAGSIGTKWDGLDMSGYLAKLGLVQVTVTATDSTDKTKAFDEALKGKPALLRSQMLDPLNDEFLKTVRANCPDVVEDALTGKVFVGQACVDAGLAHQVGSLQDAIQLAFDLAGQSSPVAADTTASLSLSPSTTSHTTMGLFGSSKTTALAAVAALSGKTGLTATDTKAANEELVAAGITDAAIITKAEYIDVTAKAGRAEAAEKLVTALTAEKTDLTAKLTASEQEVARLGALGGATPTTSGKAEGDQLDAPKAHAWFNGEHDHNKEAAALLG